MRYLRLLSTALLLSLASPLAPAQSAQSTAQSSLPAGISLPRTGTAYALDTTGSGPALVQLHPSEIVSNSHAVGNFARSMVYAGPHATVELKGGSSVINLSSRQPFFLVRINGDDPELLRSRVHLIRLEQTKDHRVVLDYSQNVFGGQHTKHFDDVPLSKKDAEPDVWLQVTPESPLTPGEYGIVFMPKDSNRTPDVVYDFNIAGRAGTSEK